MFSSRWIEEVDIHRARGVPELVSWGKTVDRWKFCCTISIARVGWLLR